MMLTTLESHINIKNIDKSDWKAYKFSDIAQSIGERIEPSKTELETYVGLEHLDSESIHIKRFGKRDDVSGTKLRCYPGDVIFGRRRAYQRKAAIVEFDGFCSAHALVLRANPKVIDPKLFPFFLHSDTFMHRAVDISVGSLSPTINWGTLKNEEFFLPPKDQQARLAELLWAADTQVVSLHKVVNNIKTLKDSLDKNIFNGTYFQFNTIIDEKLGEVPAWELKKLDDLVASPICYGIVQPGESTPTGIPVVQIKNLLEFNRQRMHYTSREIEKSFVRSRIAYGDLLLSIKGTLGVVNTVPPDFNGNIGRDIAKIRIEDGLLRNYLLVLFRSKKYQELFEKIKVGSTRFELSIGTIREIPIIIPPVDLMKLVVKIYEDVEISLQRSASSITSAKNFQRKLINQMF